MRRYPLVMLWFVLLLVAAASPAATAPARPRITRITAGPSLSITVRVPEGWQAVTLESRAVPGQGTWVPRGVRHGNPLPPRLVFEVPLSCTGMAWRVTGERRSRLPPAFYAGSSAFPRRQSSLWRSERGAGIPCTLGGDGNWVMRADVPNMESREVVEPDLWRFEGDRLYVFNQYRGLQVIDLADPDAPALLGTLPLPASGEQLFLLGGGRLALLARDPATFDQSLLLIVDASGATPRLAATAALPGSISESRLVGTALYLALQRGEEITVGDVVEWQYGTAVASFDLADPAHPVARSEFWFPGSETAVAATDSFLFMALQGEYGGPARVKVFDCRSPDGTLAETAEIPVAGGVADKFKMALSGTVFSVFSESFNETSETGWQTTLETFSLVDPAHPVALGRLDLAPGERLFATRFDGPRAYAVTFEQVDPLWIIDLVDPAHPAVAGSVEVPGWSTYIHPLRDRLVTVGVEDGRTAVSLFDVRDPAKASLASRVTLGADASWSEANWDEKAFSVFDPEGLILVPFEGWSNGVYTSEAALVDLGADTLAVRGSLEGRSAIRRTALSRNRLIALTGRELLSVDVADRDAPAVRATLELARVVNRVLGLGDYLLQIEDASFWTRNGQAVLRVSSATNTETILNRLDLGARPVIGACVQGDRLHLLQGNDGTNLLHTVLDGSALPALVPRGEAVVPVGKAAPGSFEAVWPASNLLVWVSRSAGYGPVMPMEEPAVLRAHPATEKVTMITDEARVSFLPYPWWAPGGVRLAALDVADPEHPAVVSTYIHSPSRSWGFSTPIVAQGRIYLSHEQSKPFDVLLPNGARTEEWRVAAFLDVIDYADPAHPTPRPPVRLPGQLAGVSADGALLYTVGSRRTLRPEAPEDQEAVAACAYDGVRAYLLDQVFLGRAWPRPVRVDAAGRVFIGRAFPGGERVPILETWRLNDEGRFVRLSSLPRPEAVSDLNVFGDLLAAQDQAGRVTLFDMADPAAPAQAGEGLAPGGLWSDLGRAWWAGAGGLWIPLDDYGLWRIPVL